jgi:uncharacterized protein (DUF4415 family)
LAREVFADPLALSKMDRVEDGEQRWQTVGMVGGTVILLVAHTVHDREGEEVIRIISARKASMSAEPMKKDKAAAKRKAELKALATLSDEAIDTRTIPEVTDWHGAVRGKFYRPVKKPISIRVDADVLAWFRSQGEKYQSRINEALREYMLQHHSRE